MLRYDTLVSKARLKNVLADWDLLDAPSFLEYAATVNEHGTMAWPAGRAKALPFRSRARSLLEDLTRPALLSLRMRAVFGVGARSELLRAFLSRPDPAMTAADLAAETSYRKRNVLNELEPLRFVGLVQSFRAVNVDRYSLAKREQLLALVGPLPTRSTRWTQTFRVLHVFLELTRRSAKRSDLQNAVDAVRLLSEDRELFAAAEMYPPPLGAGAAAWPAFLGWAEAQARAIARA